MTDANAVVAALKERGHRVTAQRRAIIAEIVKSKGHIAPQVIADKVNRKLPGVNASTVYRTLELLEQMGFLSHSHLEGGAEYHHAGRVAHVHLVCSNCGRAESLAAREIEPLRDLIARHKEFEPDFTHFAISGLCARCKET